ncbi:cupin domain-containing protein [Saccharopolyspora spinosa]|uniref:Cupin domain-containing protein n=1 Tax=Saccharopolyspora spinosa TaxID=60894 RepID=A0A2N3Y059_SACSN|nr:cupin domain-containing protein [Saccharopolyspora spinosa]PKW16280.1 Cupin domain-containing protein [Saccharopolyspora spinosa]
MHIGRGIPQGRETGLRSSTTTGQVWSDIVLNEAGTRALTMYFAPGSRTHWHRHQGGQLLYTIAGQGWIQERDGESATLGPGDVCWTEPGVEHWHGSAPDSQLIQLAVHFGDVEWGPGVADEEYRLP